MRVICGSARGRRLLAPKGVNTRPTSDRVKEALFSILTSMNRIETVSVLDLYCGTGALGIEALSRGAADCVFVERDRNALESLKKNLVLTGFSEHSEVIAMDVARAMTKLAASGKKFSLVFLDPPYAEEEAYIKTASFLAKGLLVNNAILVAECSANRMLPDQIGSLNRCDRRVYGDTALDFFVLELNDATQ